MNPRSISWQYAIGTPTHGYTLTCTIEEDEPTGRTTLTVAENGEEVEQVVLFAQPANPDAWQRPHRKSEQLQQKYVGRGMAGMAAFYHGRRP